MPETPTPKDYEDLKKDPFDKQKDLQDLTKEIDELKDDKDQNDIIENNVVLNNALNGKIQEYLKNNEKVTELIVAELDKIIKNPETSDSARKSAESLLNLIKSIQSTEERPEDPETTEQSQEPKLGLKGQIGEITPLPDGGTTEGRFHSDLVKEKPENLTDNEKGGPLDLWRTENQFQEQGKRIAALLAKKSELNNDEDFKNAKNLVDDILKVIENPVGPNVEKLQIFVYENLDGKDKEDFHLASFSKKDQKFDGKFGVGTLAGLNKVLEKTEKYIKGLEDLNKSDGTSETLDKPGETPENLDNVKLKNNDIKVKKGGEVKPEEWLEGLPQGAKVDIKEGQSIDMNNTEPQTITLVVTGLDGKTKEIEAKITVVENVDSDPNKPPQYPQEIVDNNGVKHPILPESQTITQNLKLNGAALYSVEQSEGLAPDEHEYIMKLGNNPENVYKIKVDKDGLCPTAENFNSKVKILFKNNPACMSYLQAKAPEGAKIGWHNGLQDYTITLNGGKTLTIEPMTIDGKWVSPDLKQCLALLNFTNFLTSAGKIDDIDFKNKNDPDLKLGDDGKLYVRVNKKEKWGEDGKGGEEGKGWYPVPMERFGLVGIDQNVLKKFIKYNNGEDWNDNWDKKDDNKGYKKIDFPVAVREGSADRNGGNGGAGLIGGGEGIIDPTLTQGRVVRGTEAPRVTEGEKISLDENTISKLNVDVLENPTDVAQKFAIPENAVVYKAKDSDTYYYKEGNDVVCIGLQPGQEWKKWKLGGEEGKTYSEGVNVCSEGKNRLNFILKDSLKELSDAGLIKEEEIGLVSISIEENDNGVKEYSFVNGGKKIPIYDVVLMGPNIENKLKSVYLASKIVPGEFELKDGNIVAKGNGTDGLNLSSDELLKYGLEGEEAKKNFVDYLNTVSDDLVDDEVDDIIIPSENLDGDNEAPELTDADKKDMLMRLQQKAEDLKGDVSTILGKGISPEMKEKTVDHLKKYFNEGGQFKIKEKDETGSVVEKVYSVDDFCNKLLNGEIDGNKIKSYNTASEFVKGQFIKETINLPGESKVIYDRKLNTFTFDSTADRDVMSGVDDITDNSGDAPASVARTETVGETPVATVTETIGNTSLDGGVEQNNELLLKKAEELKGLLKDVDVQNKEFGIIRMLMCGKADDFISKVKNQDGNIGDVFNEISNDCIGQLNDKGWEDVKGIIMDKYTDSGTIDFRWHLSNYITLTDGKDFVEKYNECKTPKEKLDLVNSKITKYNETRLKVQEYIYRQVDQSTLTDTDAEVPVDDITDDSLEAPVSVAGGDVTITETGGEGPGEHVDVTGYGTDGWKDEKIVATANVGQVDQSIPADTDVEIPDDDGEDVEVTGYGTDGWKDEKIIATANVGQVDQGSEG